MIIRLHILKKNKELKTEDTKLIGQNINLTTEDLFHIEVILNNTMQHLRFHLECIEE